MHQSARVLADALRANPLIAPYPIHVAARGNTVVLSGKVGTRALYDMVIRIAIDSGISFRDALVIDTAETARVAAAAGGVGITEGLPQQASGASLPYIYPPPLFGRIDDPFFGFEPPLFSFPSWWQPRSTGDVGSVPPRASTRRDANSPASGLSGTVPDNSPAQGKAQISVDEFGRVLLRGVVASEEVKRQVEAEAASVPGVSEVINELTVEGGPRSQDAPQFVPPPPQPQPPADAKHVSAPKMSVQTGTDSLSLRVSESLRRQPALAKSSIRVSTAQGTATLSGKVDSSYEAMLAFRAAQQTPGVREVIDQLDFSLPDEESANPLLQKARPDDLIPYLEYHIRRHLEDAAHIDRVEVTGDALKVRGTVTRAEDQERVAATVRSIPMLKGFRITILLHAN